MKDIEIGMKLPQDKNGAELREYIRKNYLYSIVRTVSESEFSEYAYLVDDLFLNYDPPVKKKDSIYYVFKINPRVKENEGFVPGQKISDVFRKDFIDYILDKLKQAGFHEIKRNGLVLDCVVEGVHYPVSFKLEELDGEIFPLRKRITTEDGKELTYLAYPVENLLMNKYITMIQKMELIHSMEPYRDAYYLLTNNAIEGRRFAKLFKEAPEDNGFLIDQGTLELFMSYQNYPYMRKKWKTYCTMVEDELPEWEKIMEVIIAFIRPVWQSIINDQVFLDEWMPDLGRYLG